MAKFAAKHEATGEIKHFNTQEELTDFLYDDPQGIKYNEHAVADAPEEGATKKKGTYGEAKKKDPNLDSYIAARKKHKKGTKEYNTFQNKINKAYGVGPTDRAEVPTGPKPQPAEDKKADEKAVKAATEEMKPVKKKPSAKIQERNKRQKERRADRRDKRTTRKQTRLQEKLDKLKNKKSKGGKMYNLGGKTGLETDPPKKAMYADEEDGGQTHRAKARGAIEKQMKDLERERRKDYSTVSSVSSYGKAHPKDRGVQSGGSTRIKENSGLAGDIDAFYDKEKAKLQKMLAKFVDPAPEKAKMATREDLVRSLGGDDYGVKQDAAFEDQRKKELKK
tara:strand:+ start:57 stop:1061 length:1005 start_codon:yes stop_codon:yes gene_type:complete